MDQSLSFTPCLFKTNHPTVHVANVHVNELTTCHGQKILHAFINTIDDIVGLAPVYGSRCVLTKLAMSSSTNGLIIRFPKSTEPNSGSLLLQDLVLCRSGIQKIAFRMDKLAASLFLDHHLLISRAVDLRSTSNADRDSLSAILDALGGELTLLKDNVKRVFKQRETVGTSMHEAAEQAWAACHVLSLSSMSGRVSKVARIDTKALEGAHLSFLAKTLRDADRLDAMKPIFVRNDVQGDFSQKYGVLSLQSDRFKTRIMTSTNQTIRVVGAQGGALLAPVKGRVKGVKGRAAQVTLDGRLEGNTIHSFCTIGKEDLTSAEGQRALIMLQGLNQTNTIVQQPFVKSIWLPGETTTWPPRPPQPVIAITTQQSLNSSQILAVTEILSDKNAISLIQGPPGTGKTSVIAASVTSVMARPGSQTMWLIAQSNVAVKNIAEKLAEVDFFDFKLLVSRDFHFDWHEHLYERIRQRVIESPDFPQDSVEAERLLSGARVILCTISMITSFRLSYVTLSVPVERVIVDEASQIEIGQYLPLLSRFEKTLKKLVFIGDEKQLAPYGHEDLSDLRSVFEVMHLRQRAIFLNTQYRMPVHIGAFISRHVYGGELRTVHSVNAASSCRFKDVPNGEEKQVEGGSWTNPREVMAVMRIARQYHTAGMAYRIITPYDAQRNRLEKALKEEQIPWENKCFCKPPDYWCIYMSFAGTPLGQGRRLDHHTFLNKPPSKGPTTSPQRSYAYGAPSSGSRSPPKPASSTHSQDDEPALARYARLKQRDQNLTTTTTTAKPDRWSVKDTTVNIANAFVLAADDSMQHSSLPNLSNSNSAWASGSRTTATSVPRSTSVEYEKETQSTTVRRFAPPPNRLAPPARSNGASRRPVSKQTSLRQVPDSEGEDDVAPYVRGKSPMEHLASAVQSITSVLPTSFNMRQRSREPEPANTSGNSYDYAAEEQQTQATLAARNSAAHKKGRMSVDNKAYRPSQSDLDESDEEDDDERRTKKRKARKGPAGGPLTSLPVVGADKRKKRKSRGSKANALEDDDDEGSEEGQSEQRSMSHRSIPNSRASQSRGSVPLYARDDSGAVDTSADMEVQLDSIEEGAEPSMYEPALSSPDQSRDLSHSQIANPPMHHAAQSFSVGAFLGKCVNFVARLVLMLFVLGGQIAGTVLDVGARRPYRWAARSGGGLSKLLLVALGLWAAWYALQRGSQLSSSFADWLPTRSPKAPYQAPDIPASNIAELSARLQQIENALSGLALEQERARARASDGAGAWRGAVDGVKSEVQALNRQVRAAADAERIARGRESEGDREARAMVKALEERVGGVEGGVREALEMSREIGKEKGKTQVGPDAAWWGKLGSDLRIKSSDGKDVTGVIAELVDRRASLYSKDTIARPDFALHSAGATIVPSLTSPTYEISPPTIVSKIAGFLSGGNGYAVGRPAVFALHHDSTNGHCWPIRGTTGQLTVALAAPVYVEDITIDHVAKEVATSDMGSAPRDMEVWGMVEGTDNVAKVQAWLAERAAAREDARERGFPVEEEPAYPSTLPRTPLYVRLATFTYDINAPKHVQTFPADPELRALGIDFGIVSLRMLSNWGQDEYTCLYRFRVHGQKLGAMTVGDGA
ncbi:hypothetical protein HWV62_3454 [Athelia sp. TMB]|nr:hypothetical protein HWV62_3454 [Athelia sp. TMB]